MVVQLHSDVPVDLSSMDDQVCIFSVSFTKLGNHFFDRVAFQVGYFYVVNMIHYSELIAAHYFFG